MPRIIVFDVDETLLDVDALPEPLAARRFSDGDVDELGVGGGGTVAGAMRAGWAAA
jgi:FMN phosphatase YigB (HAD superfamily)